MTSPSLNWIWGLSDDADHREPWQAVLLARISGQYLAIRPGTRTSIAETGLGFAEHHVYYFVNACVPTYGFVSIAFDPSAHAPAYVAPFDTGGLWHGYVATVPKLSNAEKVLLVAGKSIANDAYIEPMHSWLDSAFDEPADYSRGVQPRHHSIAEIPLPNNTHAWMWEARLPYRDYFELPCRPILVVMTDEDATSYMDWLETDSHLDEQQMLEQLEAFKHLLEVSNEPVDTMNSLISGNR